MKAPSKKSGRAQGKSAASDADRAVGILGLGIIGSRVAEACRQAGLTVATWNRTPKAGQCRSPAAVAEAARVLQIFVTDDAALVSVLEAMGPALTDDHVVLNCSTVSLEATRAAAALVAHRGAAFLDAPFTGSLSAASAGALVYYIGGDESVLKRVRWALEPSAKEVVWLGQIGDATVIKIATNLVSAVAVEALAEALGIVTAHGIPADRFLAAMEPNANSSTLSRMKLPGMVEGDFAPHFSLKNMWKDAGFAERLAVVAGLEIPALSVVRSRMGALIGLGAGDHDFSVLAVNYPSVPRRRKSRRAKP